MVYIGSILLVFIGLPIGLGLLFYFVPKKLGYPRTAKYLAIIYGLTTLTIAFFIAFEDQLFTKNDAKKLVEEQNIKLNDKFDLLKNESMTAPGEYYHTFTLKISEKDKLEAIKTIKSSKNFKIDSGSINSLLYFQENRYFGPKIIQDYVTEESYVREYFQPSRQQGFAPTFRRISISKIERRLTFEDIDE